MSITEMNRDQLVEFAGLLVTLLIFFSIDAKFRFRRKNSSSSELFRFASVIGGIAAVIALAVVWLESFLPEEDEDSPED